MLGFGVDDATTITGFDAVSASAVHLGWGSGESHAYAVHLGPGGEIGLHEAGFGQLFVVVDGTGWVATQDDRVDVTAGQAVMIDRGTVHAKGSVDGLVAIMIQILDLEIERSG